jgi:hypothetical protein
VGRDNTHTVYAGALVGIDMALALAEHAELILLNTSQRELVILTDCQAAIQASAEPNRR